MVESVVTLRGAISEGDGRADAVKKRGYTYDFTPKSEKHGRYLLDKIPADLWRRVKAKSKRDGISIRACVLQKLSEWVNE